MQGKTPKELGFIMPAEWEKHSAVWLAWPYDETTFPKLMAKAEKVYCEIIKALKGSEKIELLVLPAMKKRVVEVLKTHGADSEQIIFHEVDYGDVWTRDYCPFFLTNTKEKQLGWVKFKYNAYGKGKEDYYRPLLKDNKVFETEIVPAGKKFNLDMVLEGGSVEINGEGLLLTTEQCLLNPNRNPNLSKSQMEKYLEDYLGVKKIIWLPEGIVNDHTDGHIDDLVKFVSPNKLLCCYEDNTEDKNHEILKNNFNILKKESLEIVKLPMPHMRYNNGSQAPVSYANFYIANKAVLVPTYNDPNDGKALEIIQNCFLDRKVIGIDCRDLIYGGGSIHCITQQQPEII